jgi:hypothetical protein
MPMAASATTSANTAVVTDTPSSDPLYAHWRATPALSSRCDGRGVQGRNVRAVAVVDESVLPCFLGVEQQA